MEANIGRWATASVAEHLRTLIRTTLSMTYFVEGVDVESPEWFTTDSAVLRVTGPWYFPGSSRDRYAFEVMVLVTDLYNTTDNRFQLHDRLGSIANALSGPIPVYKYGGDDSQVGCLDIPEDPDEFLRIVHFGKFEKDTEAYQAAVIAKYEICLDT